MSSPAGLLFFGEFTPICQDLLQLDSYAIFAEAIIGTRAGIWVSTPTMSRLDRFAEFLALPLQVTVKRPEKVRSAK